MKRGKFIVFEGIDGSGKSTQAKMLYDFFRTKEGKKMLGGRGVQLTEEPTPGAAMIRRALQGDMKLEPETLQLLFSADRAEHVAKEITPWLNKGITVICDRYFFSTLAYGGLTADMDWLWEVNKKFLMPDIVFFIDASPKIAMARIEARNKKHTIFETQAKLVRLRKNYGMLKNKFNNMIVIDGGGTHKEVHGEIIDILSHNSH